MRFSITAFSGLLISTALAWEDGVDCASNQAGNRTPGLFHVFDSEGIDVYCEDINTLGTTISGGNGYQCWRNNDDDSSLGDKVKCPGDSAPKKNSDGSDAETVADGFIKTWCDNAAGGLALQFADAVGCLLYGYYESNGDPTKEAETGASGICDTIFSGACTWFLNVAPEIAEGMSRPCVDDPGSNACAFANPGK